MHKDSWHLRNLNEYRLYGTVNIALLDPLYQLVHIIQMCSITPLETATVVLLQMPFAIPDVEKAKR